MATNVPAITWINGAPVLPQQTAILAGVQTDLNNAFGGGLSSAPQSPQGQLATTETAIIGDKNSQIAYMANQINPLYASGQWQDAIGYLYFITRIQAAGTVVTATVTGAVNTVIPAGALAQDTSGYLYASTVAVTIPATGSTTVQFQNQTVGAIPCAIGALNTIYTTVAGWDQVTNAAAGSLGNLVESQQAFEQRRQQSVAGNSVNSIQSIQGAVLAVPGVIDAYTIDNPTNAAITVGSTSYPLAANSTLVSVAGGSAAAIAQAIWTKKGAGSPYAPGNTSYVLYDTSYQAPQPSYTISWLTPTATNAYFAVQIKNLPQLPTNIVALVQNAIIAAFTGTDGGIKARINQTTYAARYYAGVSATNANVEILSLLMGFSAGTATSAALTFGIDQLPVLSASNIAVTLV